VSYVSQQLQQQKQQDTLQTTSFNQKLYKNINLYTRKIYMEGSNLSEAVLICKNYRFQVTYHFDISIKYSTLVMTGNQKTNHRQIFNVVVWDEFPLSTV